jgi:flagellar hook protein FlgE
LTAWESDVDNIVADLRRAAIPGAVGAARDRNDGELVDAAARTGADRFAPSASPLAVAIDGPGIFILRDGTRTVYSRLGDFRLDNSGALVDAAGHAVAGFREFRPGVVASPIIVNAEDFHKGRFASYRIDDRGVLDGVTYRSERHSFKRHEIDVPIARLAIATFPSPERLGRIGDSLFVATRASGSPSVGAPGEIGFGSIRAHVVAAGSIDIEGDLRKLWMLSRKGEIDAALASASDACLRTALGLVR